MTHTMFAIFQVAAALVSVTLAVNLQIPMFQQYAAEAGQGAGLAAFAFALYIAGLVPALLFFGGISDRLGRKPVLLMSVGLAWTATLLMAVHPTIESLYVARPLQGAAVAFSMGTATAYLAELFNGASAERAALVTAVTSSFGFGAGGFLTSLCMFAGETSPPPSYWFVLACTSLVLASGYLLPTLPRQNGKLVRLPVFLSACRASYIAIFLAWAVSGVVVSVVPAEMRRHDQSQWIGAALFLINIAGVAVQPLAKRLGPLTSLRVGTVILPLGLVLVLLGSSSSNIALLLLGAAVAGTSCYGFIFLGGLTRVSAALPEERARAVSGYLLVGYLGFGLPSIAVGALAERYSPMHALWGFCVLVTLLSALNASSVPSKA